MKTIIELVPSNYWVSHVWGPGAVGMLEEGMRGARAGDAASHVTNPTAHVNPSPIPPSQLVVINSLPNYNDANTPEPIS